MEQPPAPPRARIPVPALIGAAALVLVLVAALLAWKPWSEREFTADEAPTSCADLFAVKDAVLPGAPSGGEEVYPFPGSIRTDATDAPGSTLKCGWSNGKLVLTLYVEYWADGADAAAASFAASREKWPEPIATDIGDEAILMKIGRGSGWFGLARTGNLVVYINPVIEPPKQLPEADVVRILEGLIDVIES